MRDSPVAQFPRPSQTVDSSRRLWPLEDHRQQTQREHTESTTEANFIGSKVGPESGPSMDFSDNSNSGLTTMTMRQDRISAMGAPKSYGQNKRPLILSPPIESDSLASFDRSPPLISAGPSSLQQQQLQQQNHNYRYYQYQQEHQIPQQQQYRPSTQTQGRSLEAGMAISRENEVQEQGAQQHNQNNISSSTTTTLREKLPESMPRANPLSLNSRRTIQTLPMPHFRGQLVQSQPDDSSYQRRFYPSSSSVKSFNQDTAVAHTTASAGMMSSTTSTSTPSAMTTTGATLSTLAGHPTSKSVSPSPGINMRKSTSVKRLQQLADNMSSGNNPSSGNASQDTSGVIGIQLGRLLISTRQHVKGLLDSFIRVKGDSLSRHPPSRLSTTTSYNSEVMDIKADMESDTALFLESDISEARTTAMNPDIHLHSMSSIPIVTGATTPSAPTAATPISVSGTADASNQSHLPHEDWERLTTDADLYKSTIEFLALMTAFVSVVCWLMQTRLLDDRLSTLGHNANNFSTTMEDIQTEREKTNMINRESFNLLKEFLSQFDDLDNVLNPIKEALSRNNEFQQKRQFNDEQEGDTEIDPMDSVGLFAWHYYLFASDQDSPFELEASAIDVSGLHSVHFDVIINELYTTHILSMTAKEHQKDHGQFYTPPGVVDFMWKRTIIERGRLLDQFVELMPKALSTFGFYDHVQSDTQKPLIPTALDPCLGVSTFLSCYIRLLIQEAERDHTESIWKSEAACRLLLTQICEHVWGIELDGFAFWMARCGILVALMPLVQHIKSFTRRPFYYHNYIHNQIPLTQEQKQQQQQQQGNLPRLHLFRSDTLQLTVPDGTSAKTVWDRHCLLQLRNPSRLQFDYIVTNPPYMIRKTGTFSAPDPEVYDWSILGATVATASSSSTASHNIPLNGSNLGSKSKFGPSTMVSKMTLHEDERRSLTPATMDTGDDDSGSEATPTAGNGSGNRVNNKSALESALQSPRSKKFMTQVRPTGSKGMMQAYGYFVWFAAQRIKPGKGVVCMITASQWLTLEFAVKLRAWLFENCLMDEFFQFEPYKVFSKVQTDSLIFKIRAIPPTLMPSTSSPPLSSSSPQPLSSLSSPLPLGDHHTVFLRHTDHRKSLAGILEDYMAIMLTPESINAANNDLNIMMSSKTREELAAVIMAPSSAVPSMSSGVPTGKSEDSTTAPTATYMYSFAPMMPTSVLTTYMLALTQDLGAICSAGTKKMNRLRAVEPLLWHRGPNTNPVYGLVVRMEYARTMFGEEMTSRWFRPALYWNGKNSPDGPATLSTGTGGSSTSGIVSVTASSMSVASSSKALHREGQFWQGRDRQRLSKKEGSPAESYCVPSSDPQRLYALCMVDKESVKILRQQMEQGVEGAQALWKYLTDVRSHFQPGLVSKRKAASSGKTQSADDEGVAYCSTNQCGSDVPEKIVHPINYGYFSKTQPRQRFFLDTDSLAVTNQCIYLTLNKLSSHYDADQCPSLTYFLTLLNSTTLQFFVLHHCQYDQQGRMRLFRESMAKIPFQDRDVKNHPERIQYVAQLGTCMIELKQILYSVVMGWKMTGSHHSIGVFQNSALGNSGRRGSTGSLASAGGTPNTIPASTTTGGGNNQGLLDWVRKGGNPPPGLLVRVREQVRRMLIAQAAREHHNHHHSFQTSDPRATSIALDPSSAMGTKGRFPDTATIITDPPTPLSSSSRSTLQLNMACSFKATDGPNQDNGHSRGQGRHSLARILNMPNDDETFMDDERLITNSPQSIPVSMSVSEEFSRDQKSSRMNVDDYRIDGKLECKVKEGVESGNKGPRSTRGSIAKGTSSTSMAMETDLEGYQYHYPSVASDPIHTFDQQKIPISFDEQVALDCDRILQALERAVTMVEMLQWAVDQYGYMLYGIRPKFQKLLEVELKIVYGSRLESLILPTTPTSATATGFKEEYETQQCMNGRKKERGAGENLVTDLGITVWDLYRWEGDSEPMPSLFVTPGSGSGPSPTNAATNLSSGHPGPLSGSGNNSNINVNTKLLPSYAYQILENAQTATQLLREIFAQFPPLSSPPLAI
ncbi:hypothetical protein FBU30_007916 [Linnemannia zychae]|nr:hypothetical protein FBU30_007916 [Linnemannia zychae]